MTKRKKIILYIILAMIILLTVKVAYFEFFKTCGDCGKPVVGGPVDNEEQRIEISLADNKIATITVDAVGNLNLDLGQNQSAETARLEQAVAEIANRPALKLVAENEEMINGKKALVMKEMGVLKADSAYIYAVRETLLKEFNFTAEVEKAKNPIFN